VLLSICNHSLSYNHKMKAEIKYLHSPDVDNLKEYQPQEKDNFGFLLQVMIGPKGEKGEESFDMMVVTPKWLMEKYGPDEVVFGKHYVIVFEYNYDNLYNRLQYTVDGLGEKDWNALALKLARLGHWEFDDYKE